MENKSSNRIFGIVMGSFFLIICIFNIWYDGVIWKYLIFVALFFYSFAILYPRALTKLNYLWFKFGLAINKYTNPIILGLIFYVIITPLGILIKIFGKDLLLIKNKYSTSKHTYWIKKDYKQSVKERFEDQF